MDVFAAWLAQAAPLAIAWPVAYAMALGGGAYVFGHLAWVKELDTNKLPEGQTKKLGIAIGVAALALALFYGVAVVVARHLARRQGEARPAVGGILAGLHARLRLLLVAPPLAALTLTNIERDSPKETFFLIALIGVIGGAAAYGWLAPTRFFAGTVGESGEEAWKPPSRVGRVLAAIAVGLLWIGYGVFFSRFSITNHHALHTSTIDLGLYDNIFYQSSHGHLLGCSFAKGGSHGSAHFDPFLILLSPFYRLYPHAEFILVLQSVWIGAGVVPVYLLARSKLVGRLGAVALAAMYALYPAIHGANMYDFHSLSLVTPMMLLFLYFLEAGRRRSYLVMLPFMLLVREDISILLCFVGLYALLSGKAGNARLGWITIAAAVVYFVIAKRVFMNSADVLNSGAESYSFAYYYDELIPNKNGAAGLLLSLLTNPVFVLKTALGEKKVLYLATLFVPLAFLPFLARTGRVLLGWGLFFTLLATRDAVYSTHFQYSSLITPMAFATVPMALRQIEDGAFARSFGLDGLRLRKALLAGAFAASLLVSWKFGGFVENATFHGGFASAARRLSPKETETYEWLRAAVAQIPEADSVGATNRVGAWISNRLRAYHYNEKVGQVDWALVDEGELHGGEQEKHTKLVSSGALELVTKHDHLALFRRKAQ